jgi:CobQ-like glutamine amidotransferase family enzyme
MIEIIRIHNELLGTYGDQGNAEILKFRANARGIPAKITDISYREVIPHSADIYLLGGAEDAAQLLSVSRLREDGGLNAAINKGAHLLAICAAYQILGLSFYADDRKVSGLELLPVETLPGNEAPNNSHNTQRFVGDICIECDWLNSGPTKVTGFENHGGYTRHLESNSTPFGEVKTGFGDGAKTTDGIIHGNIFASYLHGPLLARNPQVADHLLAAVIGTELPPFNDEIAEAFASERRNTFL